MVRFASILLGTGLLVVALYGIQEPLGQWVVWLNIIAAAAAFVFAASIQRRTPIATQSGTSLGLALFLFGAWGLSFLTLTPNWLRAWTFLFACSFSLVSLLAAAPSTWNQVGIAKRRAGSYGLDFGWPVDFFGGPGFPPYWMSDTSRGESHRGRGPKGYLRSDQRILEDISDRLWEHPEVDASEVTIAVQKGETFLEGNIPSRWAKREVERIADSVTGVQDVHNRLTIRPRGVGHVRAVS